MGARVLVCALLAAAPHCFAQTPEGFEFGVRYWLSRGQTQWSHNAQAVDPTAGNPTSVLTYEDLEGHAAELHGRSDFGHGWFIKGNAGFGLIRSGSFDDEDFLAGQIKFLDSTSSARDGVLHYLTLDAGKELWTSASGRSAMGVFAGLQQWIERIDAFGATYTVDTFDLVSDVPSGVLAISNEVRWRSLRLGIAGRAAIGRATRVVADLALVPYSDVRNADSHHLRDDLGPTPNIITTGRGRGVQAELELRHALGEGLELGLGVRHWHLRSTSGDVALLGIALPLDELESRRTGLTASLTGRW